MLAEEEYIEVPHTETRQIEYEDVDVEYEKVPVGQSTGYVQPAQSEPFLPALCLCVHVYVRTCTRVCAYCFVMMMRVFKTKRLGIREGIPARDGIPAL